MRLYTPFAMLAALAIATSCGNRHRATAHEEHAHEEHLQLTAYSGDFEVYAEATPLVAGEQGDILAHFTWLHNFKPLQSGAVTATLTVNDSTQAQHALAEPLRPGVYKFALTPPSTGKATLSFDVLTPDGSASHIVLEGLTVYSDPHEANLSATEAAASGSNTVALAKELSWNIDFSTEPCRREPLGTVIRTMAQVQPSQGDERTVVASASGIVSIAHAGLTPGRAVSAGQPLLAIEGGNLADNNIAVRHQEAESNYRRAQKEYERKLSLANDHIVSESELLQAQANYEAAEAAYNSLRSGFAAGRRTVEAPIGGYVKRLMVGNGEYVETGTPVAIISQNRDLYVRAEIPSRYYSLLDAYDSATLRPLNGDTIYSLADLGGQLVAYGKSVDTDSPLLPVVFRVANTISLLPGTFVEMFIKTKGSTPTTTVPNVAITEEMGNHFVYVQLTPELFEKRQVRIGQTDGERTEILSGLSGGERVVAKGAALVKLAAATGTLDAHSGHAH